MRRPRSTTRYKCSSGWSNGASLNIADAMTQLTLQIIAKTLFGVELSGQAEQLSEAVRIIAETFVAEAGNPVHLPDWFPLPGKRRKRWAIRTLDELVRGIIRQRRASGEDHGDLAVDVAAGRRRRRGRPRNDRRTSPG